MAFAQQIPLEDDDADKDRPLREDIRLLGRILGDTVREQEGEETFGLVEQIRQASIRFHRNNEPAARRELEATLNSLSAEQTLAIVRAFSYFSHLSNIAEDQHHIRRNRAHKAAGSPPRPARSPSPFSARARRASSRRPSKPSSTARWSAPSSPPIRPRSGARARSRGSSRSPRSSTSETAPRTRSNWRRTRRSSGARCSSSGARTCCARRGSR